MDSILRSLTSGAKFKNKSKRKLGDILSAESKSGKRSHAQSSSINLFGDGKTDVNGSESDGSDSENDSDANTSDSDEDSISRTPNLTADSSTEDINAFRNRLQIKVKGSDIPVPIVQFQDADMPSETLSVVMRNIEASDWKEPTPIQMQAIPVLTKGRDLLASAPTGSGKTAAFVIPALGLLSSSGSGGNGGGIKVLLLAPTRELAEQIHREAERLSAGRRFRLGIVKKSTASSGALEGQNNHAYSKYNLLVATPMRLVGLLRAKALDLSHVRLVVLDEADKLFEQDSGADHLTSEQEEALGPEGVQSRSSFLSQVDEILAECGTAYAGAKPSNSEKRSDKKSKKRRKVAEGEGEVVTLQRALFSATIGPFVQELAASFLHNPVEVNIGVVNAGATSIDQRLVFVGREDGKLLAIRQLIQQGDLKPPVLLFLQNKERAKELFRELVYEGINIDVIHGDRSQLQREEVIRKFRLGETWVLICTDLMARGIDFKGVKMVINYDLPQSGVAYIHRIGRTGRAGRQGEAITLFTEKDIPSMRSIANVMKLSGCKVPDWLLAVKQLKTKEKRQLRKHAPERNSISTVSKYDKQKHSKKMQIISQSKKKKLRVSNSKA